MSSADFTVFIVDDDAGVLKALSRLVRSLGFEARAFSSPQAFLSGHDATVPGCAILDVAMPGLDGLQLQQALSDEGIERPVIRFPAGEQKRLKEPRGVGQVPARRAGVRHGLDDEILHGQGLA